MALLIESSRAYGRELLLGVAKFVREHHHWSVQHEEWKWTDAPPAWLKEWNGDGVIARIEVPKLAKIIKSLDVPAVDVRGSVSGYELPLIDTEDKMVAELAAEHLMDRGFRHFAFCGFVGANYSDKRSQWFEERLTRAGFKCQNYSPPDATRDARTIEHEKRGLLFQEHVGQWLASLPRPIGVMACNDIRGQQVMNICRRLDLAVPEEMAVIGVDNDEVLCELCDPPLSSVAPDAVRIGYEAANLLERMMQGAKTPAKPMLVPPLGIVTRRSTDVLAVQDRQLAAGLRFIREHAFDNIGMNDVASAAGVSRRVFERRFVAQFGRSPKTEVLRLRLERAKELLAETDWTLGEIAEKTGFKYGEYLHTMFRQKVGITPGAFRKQAEPSARGRERFRGGKTLKR